MIIINIGNTGTGKTSRAKKLIQEINKVAVIFDFQSEYEKKNCYIVNEIETFVNLVESPDIFNCVFLCEESTIFFNIFDKTKAINGLVSNRHRNNDLIFNFHSLRAVPLYIIDFADYLILGKTNDTEKTVKRKYSESITAQFLQIQKNKNIFYYKIINRTNF